MPERLGDRPVGTMSRRKGQTQQGRGWGRVIVLHRKRMPTHSPCSREVKPPQCPWTDGQTDEMWCVHAMGYLSALERKEIPAHATTRMSPADRMLGETGQSRKDSAYTRCPEQSDPQGRGQSRSLLPKPHQGSVWSQAECVRGMHTQQRKPLEL